MSSLWLTDKVMKTYFIPSFSTITFFKMKFLYKITFFLVLETVGTETVDGVYT